VLSREHDCTALDALGAGHDVLERRTGLGKGAIGKKKKKKKKTKNTKK
jgi:hypothetical protein